MNSDKATATMVSILGICFAAIMVAIAMAPLDPRMNVYEKLSYEKYLEVCEKTMTSPIPPYDYEKKEDKDVKDSNP